MAISYSYDPKSIYSTHKFTTVQCKACGHLHTVPQYCGNRFCPVCSKPRMMRIRFRLNDMMKLISLDPGEYFSHLVLTIRSQSDAKSMCSSLVRNFRKLRNHKLFKKNVLGGAYVLELTYNDSGWHAHLHIVLHNRYIPQAELLSAWRKIVGKGGVFIKSIPKKAIINYLSKYMCKIELTDDLRDEAGNVLKGLRLFTVFGLWHNLLPRWTKIPFSCPSCGTVSWSIARDISFSDHVLQDDIIKDKYG